MVFRIPKNALIRQIELAYDTRLEALRTELEMKLQEHEEDLVKEQQRNLTSYEAERKERIHRTHQQRLSELRVQQRQLLERSQEEAVDQVIRSGITQFSERVETDRQFARDYYVNLIILVKTTPYEIKQIELPSSVMKSMTNEFTPYFDHVNAQSFDGMGMIAGSDDLRIFLTPQSFIETQGNDLRLDIRNQLFR